MISGIVDRILRDAVQLIQARKRNFYHALHEHPSREPELQSVVGRIATHRAAIEAVTDPLYRHLIEPGQVRRVRKRPSFRSPPPSRRPGPRW
ncbi:hypothetical protein [Paracoccus benzoatiresistens]|uniref:Uncharacterized protein n=1 Tax=Paracoccus benzoatiresistens TaxID=2997341 RepID=A0ABT4J8H8_9RHOB|nr:hypothetical protein [Paracoccus sp. EF6]MCZ0963391.1 hypothetical protein [Paracoccus sp. EF6]